MTAPAPLRVLVCGERDYGDREERCPMTSPTQQLLNITEELWQSAEAEVREVRTILADLVELTIYLSQASDLAPGGRLSEGWFRQKPALDRARAYLDELEAAPADMVRQARAAGVRVREVTP